MSKATGSQAIRTLDSNLTNKADGDIHNGLILKKVGAMSYSCKGTGSKTVSLQLGLRKGQARILVGTSNVALDMSVKSNGKRAYTAHVRRELTKAGLKGISSSTDIPEL